MTLIRWCKAVVPAVALLSACNDAIGPGAPEPIDSLPRQLSVGEAKLITNSNAFAFDLLTAVNSALGMSVAFDDINADFSRMSASSTPLVISDVIQKTYVDVDEEGTEAAAAASVGAVPTSAPQLMRVDRPFIFAIRERLSGSILFIGKITKLPA